jgi:hypothetical protein
MLKSACHTTSLRNLYFSLLHHLSVFYQQLERTSLLALTSLTVHNNHARLPQSRYPTIVPWYLFLFLFLLTIALIPDSSQYSKYLRVTNLQLLSSLRRRAPLPSLSIMIFMTVLTLLHLLPLLSLALVHSLYHHVHHHHHLHPLYNQYLLPQLSSAPSPHPSSPHPHLK